MSQRPAAIGLLVCEQVIIEEGTQNVTPVNSFRNRLYMPNMNPISRAPTPISPAGISVSGPICRKSSDMKA